jgi:hypothetical protein
MRHAQHFREHLDVRRYVALDNGLLPRSGERLPFAHADRCVGHEVAPPSSFQSFLLPWRRNPGTFRPVASGASGNEVLEGGGPAFGPHVKVVSVLSGPGTAAPESRLHLALAAGPGHSLAALLAREAPHRIPPSDVPAVDDGGDNDQYDGEQAWQRDRGNHAVEHFREAPP